MDNLPILYSFRRCPYAMRARLALKISNIKVELREIVLRDKPAHMLQISPKATVPVLQLIDKTVIDESLDIMIYALGRQDPDEWICDNETETNAIIKRNDTDFKYALDRYKYPDRYLDEDCSDMFDRGAEILKDLNTKIERNGALINDYSTLADYAIFPFIRQFANTDRPRFHGLKLIALETWLNNHLESDLFNGIMEKYDPWDENTAPTIFGN
ncbi:MAG: glutathione S-transferase [Bdellovibrionales bacterium]